MRRLQNADLIPQGQLAAEKVDSPQVAARPGEAGDETSLTGSSLERDCFRLSCNHALAFCLSMIFSENRYPLFRIML